MNVGRFYIIIILFLFSIVAYCFHILCRPTFTIIAMTKSKALPTYAHDMNACLLNMYVPQVTTKAFENLGLETVLHYEAIYKIITLGTFDPARIDDCVQLSARDRQDNFIHAALGSQITHILGKFFKDVPTVLLLELDQKALKNADLTIRSEQNKVDGTYFPHLYGPQKIPLACIKTIIELAQKETRWTVNALSIVVPDAHTRGF
jgi:uncharacterized protein (DUF952 family)